MSIALPLDTPQATLALVGGKGVSLSRMMTAGLPVPSGFHLTTDAYRRFVETSDLQAAINEAVAGASTDDPAALERVSATLEARFAGSAIPDEITSAILQAYAGLGEGAPAVAVRSSATAEDLPGLSFAGQQETYLNVRGDGALLEAVRRCWASLWTARALAYRARMGVDQRAIAMGVVVQTMALADVSGVLFTANPRTGDRDEIVINASFGLGEAIVAAQVTPDTYVLDHASGAVKEATLGAKAVMIVPTDGQGTTAQPVPEARRAERALSEAALRELSGLALRVEQLFEGAPQDIEWAAADGRFWLLQARPITGLSPAPLRDVRWEPPTPGSAWIRRQVVEHMPEPLSPLFDELYLGESLELSLAAMQAVMGMPRFLTDKLMDRPFFTTVHGYAYMRGNINFRFWTLPLLVPAMVVGISRLLGGAGVDHWRDHGLPTYLASIERWKGLDLEAASDEQLLSGVRELSLADALYWSACTLAIGTAKMTDSMLDRFLAVAARGRGLTSGAFLRGFPSKTLEAQEALEAIARRIRGVEELRALVARTPAQRLRAALAQVPGGRPVLEDLESYLERYGHLIYNLDFAEPTQADDPLPIMVSLKAMAQGPDQDVRVRKAEVSSEQKALVARTEQSFGPLRRRLFRGLLDRAERFGPYREEALFYVGAAWPALRRLALALGERLASVHSLATAEDVFYLKTEELSAASAARAAGQPRPDLARLSGERRELRAARRRLHPPAAVPPAFKWNLGPIDISASETQRRNTGAGMTLQGFAVSPGRVTAPVSVIRSPADFDRMEAGTILVCPTTTPAWTPLFAQARGLVTDIGSILAHGSIVAREYGIPAVMGTGNATQRITHGQQVTVDGDAGTVTLVG